MNLKEKLIEVKYLAQAMVSRAKELGIELDYDEESDSPYNFLHFIGSEVVHTIKDLQSIVYKDKLIILKEKANLIVVNQ